MFCSNQNFWVDNCTDFCLDSADNIFGTKNSHCHARAENATNNNCECYRPYFPKNGECVTALHALQITGFEWIIAILVIFGLWDLYNIFYAIWILRLKGPRCSKEECCRCQMNLVAYGAVFALVMVISRLLRNTTDPYYYSDVMHDRLSYVFTELCNAMSLLLLCCVFLSFNKAVQSQSRDDTADRRKCAKRTVIVMTAAGVTGYISRDIVVIIFRAVDRAHFESSIYVVYNAITFVAFLSLLILMTVEARTLHLSLINFSKTFQGGKEKSAAGVLAKIDDLVTVLKRYLYPIMFCGFTTLVVLATYTACVADWSPWSYIFSWIMIDVLISISSTLMLLVLEGSPVTAFPGQVVSCFCRLLRCQANDLTDDKESAEFDCSTHAQERRVDREQ